ncbi:MAG: alpha/beta hydrolase [Rhodospirillaceae bacterium]|jgi:hypothetical protein|nr:alpha/beta hydrolase [Rhodospirillales bacterium]MBT3905086.1 alpha/beta hydrolase [Rhodospirillaceae bacterium]MBT4699640.1 alpha/beta hydrolase [Rhodospirillaceae bacterium]MBT5034251.1 alpha/beta hydrolase [Rhodospirillaceae bacterium]MBT6218176.1 alpha/beta hydrolase [Rhodospirillaceae bacterium]
MISIVSSLLGAYLVFVIALFALQRSMIYHPGSAPPSPTQMRVPEMKVVSASTADGLELSGWFAPPKPEKPLIVLFHGNAGSVADRAFKARRYMDWGYGVLLAEYRGFGGNPGNPSEEGLYADARAWLKFADDQGLGPDNLVIYGESLGSGPAVRMAWEFAKQNTPVAALVLEAPYTTLADVAQHHYPIVPAQWLVRDRFNSAAIISEINTPLIIVHGTLDGTVPVKFGQALFNAASEPKTAHWIKLAGHNNLYDSPAAEVIDGFLARALAAR